MDFKIGDEIEEDGVSQSPQNKKLSMIIVAVVSITIGLTVFFVSNALFGKEKKPEVPVTPPAETTVSLQDENVKVLYDYVKYGTLDKRNDKFIKEQNVTLSSFNNSEKFYYALQFAQVEDFAATGRLDENNKKIYNIANNKIKTYMQRFFGEDVTYSTNTTITYPFSFRINSMNVGTMNYSVDSDGFDTVFASFEDNVVDTDIVKPYYTELVKATKKNDGSLELTEKIIYTDVEVADNIYNVHIYKDYQKTMPIEDKTNLTREMLKENPISISDYTEQASTITYLFKLNSSNYYFYSSVITN